MEDCTEINVSLKGASVFTIFSTTLQFLVLSLSELVIFGDGRTDRQTLQIYRLEIIFACSACVTIPCTHNCAPPPACARRYLILAGQT